MATSLQLSLSSVPIVAIMERFNNKVIKQCMYSRKQTLIWQQKWMYSDASFDVAVVVAVVFVVSGVVVWSCLMGWWFTYTL